MKKIIQRAFIVISIIIHFPCFAYDASDQKATTDRLQDLRHQINIVQSTLAEINQSKHQEQQKLKAIVLELNSLQKQFIKANQELEQLDSQLKELQLKLSENQQQLDKHQQQLSELLLSRFYSGHQAFTKLLLNQQEPAMISRVMTYYQYLNHARIKNIMSIKQLKQLIVEQQQQIEKKQQQVKEQKNKVLAKEQKLKEKRHEQNQLITRLSSRQEDTQQNLEQLQIDEQSLNTLLETIKKSITDNQQIQAKKKFAKLKKRLKWPSRGRLRKLYGRWRSIDKVKWNGNIIINADGTPVYAIAYGQIVYADWLRGYGLLTIIDHGDGYMSLYGFNESLLKNVGDIVMPGEQIAASGRSTGRKEASSYFEIRKNGRPVNPSIWCKAMP